MIFLPPTRYNGLLEFDSLVHTPMLGANAGFNARTGVAPSVRTAVDPQG